MRTDTSTNETTITIDGGRPLAHYSGLPYTFVTYDGAEVHGVTDVDHTGRRLIVRLPGSKWAYARVEWLNA